MFDFVLEQNLFVYVMVALGVIGVFTRIVLNGYISSLIAATESMGATRKKALLEIRQRYEDIASLNVEIKDMDSFVGKYIEKMRIGKIQIASVNNFVKNIFIITAGTGILSAVYQYYVIGSGSEALKLIVCGIICCLVLLVTCTAFDVTAKKNMLRFSVQNYLGNSLANRLEKLEIKQAAASEMSQMETGMEESVTDEDTGKGKKKEWEMADEQVAACDVLFEKLLQGIISDA